MIRRNKHTRAERHSRRSFLGGGLAGGMMAAASLVTTALPSTALGFQGVSELLFTKIRHSTFLLQMAGRHILIDPWFGRVPAPELVLHAPAPALFAERLGGLDLIVVTSSFPFHCDGLALRQLVPKHIPCLVPNQEVQKHFYDAGFSRVHLVRSNDEIRFEQLEDLSISVSPAREGSVGFHFDAGGRTAWHSGSLSPLAHDARPRHFALTHKAELALMCWSRQHWLGLPSRLAPAEAYALARLAKARYLVPQEDDVRPAGVGKWLASLDDQARVQPVQGGPWLLHAELGTRYRVAHRGKAKGH